MRAPCPSCLNGPLPSKGRNWIRCERVKQHPLKPDRRRNSVVGAGRARDLVRDRFRG